MESKNRRAINGKVIEFDDSKRYETHHLSALDPEDFDFEGDDVETFRPMSEVCFQMHSRVPGFADHLGGNYATYLKRWYEERRSKPCTLAVSETARQLRVRQRQLDELFERGVTESDSEFQLAERNCLIAQELCDWATAGMPDVLDDDDLSFYDEFRTKDKNGHPLDYWILHKKLADPLSELLKTLNSDEKIYYMCTRHDVETEILYDNNDNDDNDESTHVVYKGVIPRNYFIVCTQSAGVKMTEVVLDNEELLNRKRIRNQADRDLRKRRRDERF